jgi:hypothetical protein
VRCANMTNRDSEDISRKTQIENSNAPLQRPTPNEQVNVLVKDDRDDQCLHALIKEHELALARVDKYDDRIFQFIGVGATVLGAITGYIITNRNNVSEPRRVRGG